MVINQFVDKYSWLSNFEPCLVELDGKSYPSVEHAYQSEKTMLPSWKFLCKKKDIKAYEIKIRSKNIIHGYHWNDFYKVEVMEKLLIQKYNQEPFKTMLIETNPIEIIEGNYHNDTFWGFCLKNNVGKNTLGKLIMKIRENLITL